jgi:hypothetical protein
MARRTALKQPLDIDALREEVSAWYALKEQANLLNEELETRKNRIKAVVQKYGETDPETGSLYLDLGDPLHNGIAQLKNQCSTSSRLNEEVAEEILTEKDMWKEMIEWIAVPDEARIRAAYYDNKVSDDELARMFPKSVRYSFFVLDEDGKPIR